MSSSARDSRDTCRARLGFLMQSCQFDRRQRPRKVIPLDLVTAVRAQEFQLLLGFDAFGNNLLLQAMRHTDDGDRNRSVIRIGGDVTDEGEVDLERIDREALEISKTRVTGPEVIDGNPDAEGFQPAQDGNGPLCMCHQRAFRQLEFKQLRVDAVRAYSSCCLQLQFKQNRVDAIVSCGSCYLRVKTPM